MAVDLYDQLYKYILKHGYKHDDILEILDRLKDTFCEEEDIDVIDFASPMEINSKFVDPEKPSEVKRIRLFLRNNNYYLVTDVQFKDQMDAICKIIKKCSPTLGNLTQINSYILKTFSARTYVYTTFRIKQEYRCSPMYYKQECKMFRFENKEDALKAMDWLKENLVIVKLV